MNDRDGLYVAVTPAGSISFRYNHAIHGRQETVTFGRYGVGGITLAEARERLGEAKKMIATGGNRRRRRKRATRPGSRMQKRSALGRKSGCAVTKWPIPPATCAAVLERELKPKFGNQKLVEINHEDLRALTDAIVERGAPATAVHAREVVLQVYRWAIERGQKVENPADLVRPTTGGVRTPRNQARPTAHQPRINRATGGANKGLGKGHRSPFWY